MTQDRLTAGVLDLNGQFRGKRFPLSKRESLLETGFRMPCSLMGVDIWGRDAEGSKLVFETGDADANARPTERGPLITRFDGQAHEFIPCALYFDDDAPFAADPRQALAEVLLSYSKAHLTPVVASELEFYLTDPQKLYARALTNAQPMDEFDMVSIDEIDKIGPFLDDLYRLCEDQNIPADTAVSENGEGQFEVNLTHVADAMKAADDAVFFKKAVKACANHHKLSATFMAKPFGTRSGSGLHIHFSILDKTGANIFDLSRKTGRETLEYAVQGCLLDMPDNMAVFAPHLNSFRRFAPHSHAPSKIAWGYENRTTAIRIPGGASAATRIEHRVAGADANPYLVLATVLASALKGMEEKTPPPKATSGDAYALDLPELPTDWRSALSRFSQSGFSPILIHAFLKAKEQEMARFASDVSALEYRSYLDRV